MKNILLLTESLYSGGAERQFVGLANFLKKKGYNVKVITYYNRPFYKENLDNNNISNEVICDSGNKILRILKVNSVIKDYKADVVISYLDIPNIIACICKLLKGGGGLEAYCFRSIYISKPFFASESKALFVQICRLYSS